MGDEPAFMTPFQYIFAGRPDKATDRVRRLMSINYSTNIAGLPGKPFILYHVCRIPYRILP
jgi:putative alpha-1,2-mannosidase